MTKTVTRQDGANGRFYLVDGESFPSVTHILSVLNKPALVTWAANTEREAVLAASADLYEDIHGTPKMARAVYLETLKGRIGKEKAFRKESAKACEIGSEAHALAEWHIRKGLGQTVGPEPRVTDKALWAFMAFQDWALAVGFKPLAIEQTVFSRRHQYAGTMDLLGTIETTGLVTALGPTHPVWLDELAKRQTHVTALCDLKTSKAIYAESSLQVAAYMAALEEMGHERADLGLVIRLPKSDTDPAFEVALVPPVAELLPTFLAVRSTWAWWYAEEQKSKAAWKAAQAGRAA